MEKAMEKVEHSDFFRKLSDQFQSLKLPETLIRPLAAKVNANGSILTIQVSANESVRRQSAYLEGNSTSHQNTAEIGMEIVVYGVGSILSSEVSRCQLSLALLLRKKFLYIANVLVFDPVLTALEQKVITCLGCSMLMHNEEGRRTVKVPTVFYMPHCEVTLYDNLLQANWVDHHLSSLAILGNSFGVYQERWSTSPNFKIPRPNYVLQLQKHVEEHTIDASSFPVQSAFNDMSWHLFPLK
ncbi:hypothetical protein O6H91_22G063300 [Diphasiastrum complanatum]|nr:hypothetical protein O6H91_22G063300 [Diphasiastrum complanatum]